MKKLLCFFALLFPALLSVAQEAPEGLFISSKAPNFKATNQYGADVELKELTKKGKIILVFYRGQWCPYCNKFLSRLQDSIQLINDKGATLVAITPEIPESVKKTLEKTKVEYSVLYDKELKIMKAYDVDFQVPENTITRYRNTGIDLEKNNGSNGNVLPVPAVFIIDKESTVIYRFFETDYKKRPSIKELLDNL